MGNIDIYHSRRTKYEKCWYWVREEKAVIGNLDKWILQNKSNGSFYAKEVNPMYNQENQLANVMLVDKNVIALETDDDIDEVSRGCVILYDGHPWIVDTVQKILHRRESAMSNVKHYKYILSIRR